MGIGAIVDARAAVGANGRLRPLRRKEWGSCSAVAVAVGRVLVHAAIRGGMVDGVGRISGDGTFGVEVLTSNISASWRSASSCGSEMGAKGDAGWGCWRATMRSLADSIAASAEEVVGIAPR